MLPARVLRKFPQQVSLPGNQEQSHLQKTTKRIYPNNNLASHILGGTDIDGNGIAGVEKNFEAQLQKGNHVTLSIHSGIQHITRKLLLDQITKFEELWMNSNSVWKCVPLTDAVKDKIVKNFFRKNSAKNNTQIDSSKCLRVLTKKPLRPSREEVAVNSSSRSAKMRVAEKL